MKKLHKTPQSGVHFSHSGRQGRRFFCAQNQKGGDPPCILLPAAAEEKFASTSKPNLMQCTSKTYPTSFLLTDPKDSLLIECGTMLHQTGYQIKVLNTINFSKSMRYNSFAYLHSEKDVLKLVNIIISNTKGEGEKSATLLSRSA